MDRLNSGDFGDTNSHLKADDLEIVVTWKHAVIGKFYVFRYLKKYTVFLTSGGSPNKAYGVLGLADPLEEVIGPSLPRLVTTVLLPFQGNIVYDGLVSGYNITFGGGIKRTLNDEYKQAKEAFGIITSLGDDMRGRNGGKKRGQGGRNGGEETGGKKRGGRNGGEETGGKKRGGRNGDRSSYCLRMGKKRGQVQLLPSDHVCCSCSPIAIGENRGQSRDSQILGVPWISAS